MKPWLTIAARSARRGLPAVPPSKPRVRTSGDALRRRLLFPDLAEKPISLMPSGEDGSMTEATQAALTDISNCMLGPIDPSDVSDNPSAFTYFGQFVFHDMVFSRIFGAPNLQPEQRTFANASREASICPACTAGAQSSIRISTIVHPSAIRHSVGSRLACRVSATAGSHAVDGKVERARDLPRIDGSSGFLSVCGRKEPHRPLIADPRNDDNLILSQLHCTLMQVHNRIIDLLLASPGYAAGCVQ